MECFIGPAGGRRRMRWERLGVGIGTAASDGDKKLGAEAPGGGEDGGGRARDWYELTPLVPAGHREATAEGGGRTSTPRTRRTGSPALHGGESIIGHVKIVDLLCEGGGRVHSPANIDVTALWLAAGEGRADVTRSLLKKDADASNARSDTNEVGRGG